MIMKKKGGLNHPISHKFCLVQNQEILGVQPKDFVYTSIAYYFEEHKNQSVIKSLYKCA